MSSNLESEKKEISGKSTVGAMDRNALGGEYKITRRHDDHDDLDDLDHDHRICKQVVFCSGSECTGGEYKSIEIQLK